MTRMFPFITATWNPLGGECLHHCSYCWARKLAERNMFKKYRGKPRIVEHELKRAFKESDFVFVCDMNDLFGHWVPAKIIDAILLCIRKSPATFLLLTKNPARYAEFKIPENCVCGATIESDIGYELSGPPENARLEAMTLLQHPRKMISIEPIMRFSPNFIRRILSIQPEFVAVGYDNYHNGLTEPPLELTEMLIHGLEAYGIKVYRKTLREPCKKQETKMTIVKKGTVKNGKISGYVIDCGGGPADLDELIQFSKTQNELRKSEPKT
jgi:DNA repair photolyase